MSLGADTQTHIPTLEPKQFQETRHVPATGQHTPGLKIKPSSIMQTSTTLFFPAVCKELAITSSPYPILN